MQEKTDWKMESAGPGILAIEGRLWNQAGHGHQAGTFLRRQCCRLPRMSHRRRPPRRHSLLPQHVAAKVSTRCWRTLLKIALRRAERQPLSKPWFRGASKPVGCISRTRC